MQKLFFLLFIIFNLVCFGILFYFLWIKRKNHTDEIGEIPIYSNLSCGGRFNSVNLTIPFVRLSLYKKFLVISYSKKYLIPYSEITKVYKVPKIIMDGVAIEHDKIGIPKKIVIWSNESDQILRILNLNISSDYKLVEKKVGILS